MGAKTITNNEELKKTAFKQAYQKSFGNITQSCKAIGINRTQYYEWMKDGAFKQELQDIEPNEVFVDFAESALVTRISNGDTTAIIFALKTKGKKRGYIERTETDVIRDKSISELLEDIASDNNTSSQSSIDGDTERAKSFELFEGQKMEAEQSL